MDATASGMIIAVARPFRGPMGSARVAVLRMNLAIARQQAQEIALSLLLVAAMTAAIAASLLVFQLDHITVLYLIPVLVAATRWGVLPAVCAAIAGVGASAFFFYAPIYSFAVNSYDQVIDLVLFTVVAVVTGHLGAAVRRAKVRAEAEDLRDALIGSVSHELRTPLAAIVGSTSVLSQSPAIASDETLSSLVRVARGEAERLNDDIQNLLDATRISTESLRSNPSWVDPEDIVSGALARNRGILEERTVAADIPDDLPLMFVDQTLVERGLSQIIANAAKYSPAGTPIAIGVVRSASGIEIKVTDHGPGLEPGEEELIFTRFYRNPRVTSGMPGSGLGLWIARALVASCGGRVRAHSSGRGQGTTVSIEFPLQAQPSGDTAADD
jgi:K+-sensing histidine kinase KdpD